MSTLWQRPKRFVYEKSICNLGCINAVCFGIGLTAGNTNRTNSNSNTYNNSSTINNSEQTSKVEVLSSQPENDSNETYIVGQIKNTSGSILRVINVQINLYDKNGNQVGEAVDGTNNLEKEGIWKFKAPILDDNVSSYKISNIIAY